MVQLLGHLRFGLQREAGFWAKSAKFQRHDLFVHLFLFRLSRWLAGRTTSCSTSRMLPILRQHFQPWRKWRPHLNFYFMLHSKFPPNPRYRQLFRNSARQPWNKSTTLMTWTPQPSMPKKTLTPWMFWTQTKPSRDCPSWPISPRPGWNTNVVPNEPRHRTFAGEQLGMLVRGLSRFMPVPHNCQTFSVHKP